MTTIVSCPSCGAVIDPGTEICAACRSPIPAALSPNDPTLPLALALALPERSPRLTREVTAALAPGIQILGVLGHGGMGIVYLGRDPVLKRSVAVKVLAPELSADPTARARFLREAQAAAAVAHPNVVGVFHVGTLPESDTPFTVMQFIDGASLERAHPLGQPVREPVARRIVGEVASALAAAHARGLVHRDIKPSNVILETDTGRAVVVDFGIAAALDRQVFQEGTLSPTGLYLGTPAFTSPEQITHLSLSGGSDVYSLGIMAFKLFTGRLPFLEDSPLGYLAAHLKEVPPKVSSLRPDLDAGLAQLVDRCLAKDPAQRPSASEIARYLLPAPGGAEEWPPPGLEPLKGEGAKLLAAGGRALVLALLSLWLVPRQVREWHDWEIVIGILGAAVGLQVFAAVWRSLRLLELIVAGRRARYTWAAMFDVAMDGRDDTSSLINGVGPFALVDPAGRLRLRKLRRWRAVWLVVALLAQGLAPLVWLYGIGTDHAWPSDRLLTGGEVLLLFAPAMLALVGAGILGSPEWLLRFRTHGLRMVRPRFLARLPRAELVRGWLAASEAVQPAVAGGRLRVAALFALALVLVALLNATILVTEVVTVASRAPMGAETDWRLAMGRFQRSYDPLAGLMEANLDLLEANPVAEPGAASALFLYGRSPGDVAALTAVLAVDSRAIAQLPFPLSQPRRHDPDAEQLLVSDRWPLHLAAEERAALARDTLTPWLLVWRRAAHSSRLPPLWYLRPGMPGILRFEDLGPIQDPGLEALPELGQRNLSAAVLALEAGDRGTAVLRARENLLVGWQLMSGSLGNGWGTGRQILDQGATALRSIGELTGDATLILEGSDIREKADSLISLDGGRLSLAWALTEPAGLPQAAWHSRAIPPALRARWLSDIGHGHCGNAREILFGVQPLRRATLDSAASAMADLPWAADLVRLTGGILDDQSGHHPTADPPGGLSLGARLHWLGAGGIRHRLDACRAYFRGIGIE
jgi:tRNA A-37 threonylcarbamoyl transferase component Bud32